MEETSKTRLYSDPAIRSLLKGRGIDIGCANDPILPDAYRFDFAQGDANHIGDFVFEQFDYVYSSHTLEHMRNPKEALAGWWRLVKPGGHLIVTIPDEDLYEQGCYPSLFNSDHKATFTLSKAKSWSPVSINVLDLVKQLPQSELIRIELQDFGINRNWLKTGASPWAKKMYRIFMKISRPIKSARIQVFLANLFFKVGAVLDQTMLLDQRVAQILFVAKKTL